MSKRVWLAAALVVIGGLCAPRDARALSLVSIRVSDAVVSVGDPLSVELYATFTEPVLGFGLDLSALPGSLELVGGPEIGSDWLAVGSSDGDDIAGVAFPGALVGADILLARLTFEAAVPGIIEFTTSTTPGDLGEGFALDPIGFDLDVVHGSAQVTVVPEPIAAALLLGVFASVACARRIQ